MIDGPSAGRAARGAAATPHPSVLLVDDEPGILEIASAYLAREGFTVRTAATGGEALEAARSQMPDMIVLDLMLPDVSGEEVCTRLRRRSAVPILMLTARSAEADRLRGLALGADDYLVKPFSPRELVARCRAILRRAGQIAAPAADLVILGRGRLEVDLAAHEVMLHGQPLSLTATEFRLLAALARAPGRAFRRRELLAHLRDSVLDPNARTVDVHVMRLRRKMERLVPGSGGAIATVYGVGYRLTETDL